MNKYSHKSSSQKIENKIRGHESFQKALLHDLYDEYQIDDNMEDKGGHATQNKQYLHDLMTFGDFIGG